MKTSNCFRLVLVGSLFAAALLGSAQAKKPAVGFEAFEGDYKAQSGIVTLGSESAVIVASLKVTVPKSGKRAIVSVSGTSTYGSTTTPIFNTLVFTPKTASLSEVVFGLFSSPAPGSGSAKLNGKGTAITYNAVYAPAPEVLITGSLRVQPQGKKKKKLTLNLIVASGGSAYNFQIVGVAKVKPETENEHGPEKETEKD